MTPDTAALRELADTYTEAPGILVPQDTVRALCDAADEVERLRSANEQATRHVDAINDDRRSLVADLNASCTAHAALVAALRDAQDRIDMLSMMGMQDFNAAERDQDRIRAEKAEAQVAAVLALCDEAAPRRMGDGYLSASVLAPEDVRAAVDAAGATQADDGAAVDAGPPAPVLTESAAAVPSSPDLRDSIDAEAQVRAMRFHDSACLWLPDLREHIAQRIDQAWAEANDRRPRSEYRDGYLDGLEHAESIARSTPLTMGGAS